MGNSKSNFESAIRMEKDIYFAGEHAFGQLYINAHQKFPCAKIILHIQGFENSEFKDKEGLIQKGNNRLIDTYFPLQEYPHGSFLIGQYIFPFQFTFMQHLPGSYNESKKHFKASICYSIKAVFIPFQNTKSKQIQISQEVILREPQKEGHQMLYGQTFLFPKRLCFSKGVSKICCYFEKNFYIPEEECIIICEVDNTKCQVSLGSIDCHLIKKLTLTSFLGKQFTHQETINSISFPGANAGQYYLGEMAQRQALTLKYKNTAQGLHPSTSGKMVRSEYFIEVYPRLSGCCSKVEDSLFGVKLNVLQPAQKLEKLQEPQNWKPHVERQSQILLGVQENDLLSSMDDRFQLKNIEEEDYQ